MIFPGLFLAVLLRSVIVAMVGSGPELRDEDLGSRERLHGRVRTGKVRSAMIHAACRFPQVSGCAMGDTFGAIFWCQPSSEPSRNGGKRRQTAGNGGVDD